MLRSWLIIILSDNSRRTKSRRCRCCEFDMQVSVVMQSHKNGFSSHRVAAVVDAGRCMNGKFGSQARNFVSRSSASLPIGSRGIRELHFAMHLGSSSGFISTRPFPRIGRLSEKPFSSIVLEEVGRNGDAPLLPCCPCCESASCVIWSKASRLASCCSSSAVLETVSLAAMPLWARRIG